MDIYGGLCGKISAINLKEVEVKFNQKVDAETAENDENYTISNGITVESATLLDDEMTVRLELTNKLTNQAKYKISIKNIKAGSMTLAEVKDMAFMPIDNTLPTVVSVTSLGNKAVKVVFSEPIEKAAIGSFKLDGKAFYGSNEFASRSIILKPYDASALSVGEHTLTVAGVVDYCGFKSLSEDIKFTVVQDDVKPVVSNVTATLEKVTVTFSEDVDPDTVSVDNVYWKSGNDKMKAVSKTQLAGDKYEFDFTGRSLPGYETTLYVEGVKDYSGNEISETTVKVKATIDETRPEVTEVKADDSRTVITVKFNKKIQPDSNNAKYFVITDKDGKVRSIKSVGIDSDCRVLTVTLYSPLPQGTNTIKISGIQDATTLKNTMLDYSTEITFGDTKAPEVAYTSTNATYRRVIINFSEKMDASTIANPANYIITFNNIARQMPSDAEFTVIQDSKAILITFPDKIADKDVTFGGTGLTKIQVMGVKDLAGNILKDFSYPITIDATDEASFDVYDETISTTCKAAITDLNVIGVKFNKGIAKAGKADFSITGKDTKGQNLVIDSVSADHSDVVTIKTTKAINQNDTTLAIATVANNGMETTAGSGVNVASISNVEILDMVAPRVTLGDNQTKLVTSNLGDDATIELPFNENLDNTTSMAELYGDDLIVTRKSDNSVLKNKLDYTTALKADDQKIIVITVKNSVGGDSEYTVAVKPDAKYIRDTASAVDYNYALEQSAIACKEFIDFVPVKATVTGTYGTADSTKISANETIILTFDDVLDTTALTPLKSELATSFASAGFDITSSTVGNSTVVKVTAKADYAGAAITTFGTDGKVTLTAVNLKDDAENAPAADFTLDLVAKTCK